MINFDLKLDLFMGARKTFEIESCSYQIRSNVSRDFFGNIDFSKGFTGRGPKRHNSELWRIIFSNKHVWMALVGVIYYGKCYYQLFQTLCSKESSFKIARRFLVLLIWDKNLGSHNGWPPAKPLWIRLWHVLSLMDSASNIWLFGQIVGDNTLIYDNTLLAKIHANVTK